jgi:hypothetical protein
MVHRAAFAPHGGARTNDPDRATGRLLDRTISLAQVLSASMSGRALQRTMIGLIADADPSIAVRLSAGAFLAVPADQQHLRRCVSPSACMTIRSQDRTVDVLPVAQ